MLAKIWEEQELPYIACGNIKWYKHLGKLIELFTCSLITNSIFMYLYKRNENMLYKDFYANVHSSYISNQKVETTRKVHEGAFCSDGNVLYILIWEMVDGNVLYIFIWVIVAWVYVSVKIHQIIHLRSLHLAVCKIYPALPPQKQTHT